MNDPIMCRLHERARTLSNRRPPLFYERFQAELNLARELFFDHPMILRCQQDVMPLLNDNIGHGIQHAKKVAIDASVIVLVENQFDDTQGRKLALDAQIAGLLHDICRLETDHAEKSAELSSILLNDYPLTDQDKFWITQAIRYHEDLTPTGILESVEATLISGALYDADKFRWGPDNFSTTLWEMCDYLEWSLPEILAHFPSGVEKVRSVASTFRTETGKFFGPEFIEIGLELGQIFYQELKQKLD